MRKLFLTLAFLLVAPQAWAQCTGVFPANTLCGNLSGTPQPPAAFAAGGTVVGPASSTSGHIATFGNNVGSQLFDLPTITTSQAVFFTGITGFQSNATFSFPTSFNALTNFTSTFQVNSQTIVFPAAADTLGGLGTSQSWTGTNNFSGPLRAIGDTTLSHVISEFFNPAIPVGSGGTGNATLSAHTVLLGSGTTPVSATSAGVTGQCVVSNGATIDPAFISGCRVLLASTTVNTSTASISDTTHITSTYNDYDIVLENCQPVASANNLIMFYVVNGGNATSNYVNLAWAGTGGGAFTNTNSTTSMPLVNTTNNQNNSAPGYSGTIRLHSPTTTGIRRINGVASYNNASGDEPTVFSGYLNVGAVVTGFQIQYSVGNIAACGMKLYGLL